MFRYADTASVRCEIVTTSARLKLKKVAIVGLGGTGAYLLDQVAKTPVWEIHLFDGDTFRQHNAFRSPGAATMEEVARTHEEGRLLPAPLRPDAPWNHSSRQLCRRFERRPAREL